MSFYQELGDWEKMKFRKRVLILIGLLNLFAVVLIASYGTSAWQDLQKVIRGDTKLQISISGEGKVSVRPDIATINASIVTEGKYLKDVQDENSKKSNVLVAYLKSMGVVDADIKTVGYNISPQYRYPQPCPYGSVCPDSSNQPQIIGYHVDNSYEIKIRDLTKAGDILGGVVGAGANQVSNISFTIDEPDTLKAEARKKAIDDAKAKAEKLAHDLGRSVGPIITFSEGGSGIPMMYQSEVAYGKGGGMASPAPAVAPGENDIVVDVSITYEFR